MKNRKTLEEKSTVDPKFKYVAARMPGGENIKYCFQCGKCDATCPIMRIEGSYRPSSIIRAILLGLKDAVFERDIIWFCATCYSCMERCPQGVKFTEVIRAIRNLAVDKGRIHPALKKQFEIIAEFGRIFENEEFINEMRADLGLPKLTPVKRDEINELLKQAKMKLHLHNEKWKG